MIQVSRYSSLDFGSKWKLDFQIQEHYHQRFKPSDTPRVQYAEDPNSPALVYININDSITEITPTVLVQNETLTIKEFTLDLVGYSGNGHVYFEQNGEIILSSVFEVTDEVDDTILLEYTHRRNDFDTYFNIETKFCFRVEGVFLPQEYSFDNETEGFRDQRHKAKELSSYTIEKRKLTIGGGFGVPNWVARLVNNIFSLSNVHVDGIRTIRSNGSAIEISTLHNDYPLYIYKLELETTEDEEAADIISLLRVVDSKKKVARSTGDSVRTYNVLARELGVTDSKMIRELLNIAKISDTAELEVDIPTEANSNKITVKQLREYILSEITETIEELKDLLNWFGMDNSGNIYVKGGKNFYTEGGISAGGPGKSNRDEFGTLDGLVDVLLTNPGTGDVLSFDGSHWRNVPRSEIGGGEGGGLDEEELKSYLTTNQYATQPWVMGKGYATEAWVKQQGYLTQHQSLLGYATEAWVTERGYATKSYVDGNFVTLAAYNAHVANRNSEKHLTEAQLAGLVALMWAIGIDSNDNVFIRGNRNLYTLGGGISVGGPGGSSGGGSASDIYNRLDDWGNYDPSAGDVLSAVLGYGLKTRIETLEAAGSLSSVTVKLGSMAYQSVGGVVSLPAYPTSLPASDVYAWAKASTKPSYSLKEIDSVITHSNEFNFVDQDITAVYFNYSGKNGSAQSKAITDYVFWDGTGVNGKVARIVAKSFLVNGGASSQFMKADGSLDSTVYAPKATTLAGYGITNAVEASIQTDYICFRIPGYGYIVRYGDTTNWKLTDKTWENEYTIWHSGNLTPSSYLTKTDAAATYLPLGGGKLTSTERNVLYIKSTHNNGPMFHLSDKDDKVISTIGHIPSAYGEPYGLWIGNEESNIGAMFGNDGEAYIINDLINLGKAGKIYHSGNSNLTSVNWAADTITLKSYDATDWAEPKGSSRIKLFTNLSNTVGTAPRGWASGISVMTSYVGFQLGIHGGAADSNLYFRKMPDTQVWAQWQNILHSSNYNSYAPKLDGTGAMGTWGINVSGNAASATKLQTARKLWGQSFDGSGDVSGSLEVYATGGNWDEGIRIHPTSSGWTSIVLCEAANLGSGGTSANTWSIHNYEGEFGIYKNGANTTASAYIANKNGKWSIGGNVGIGTTSPIEKLHVVGNVYVEGNIIATGGVTAASVSDARLKENVRELTGAMDVINRIGVRKFNYNATALSMDATLVGEHAGYIAQEFERVLPQYTRDMYGCKYLGIQYDKMIPYLTAGLQEVDRKAETIKAVTEAILGVMEEMNVSEKNRIIITNNLNRLRAL